VAEDDGIAVVIPLIGIETMHNVAYTYIEQKGSVSSYKVTTVQHSYMQFDSLDIDVQVVAAFAPQMSPVSLESLDHFLANVNSRSRSLYVIARPSVCRLSVTLVHPTQAIEIFRNVSAPFGSLATHWYPGKILRRSS